MNRIVRVTLTPVVLLTTTVAVVPLTGHAEDNDSINSRPTVYAEGLRNGWRDWSWDSSVSLWDSSYSHSGNYSASCSYLQPWAGLYFAHNTVNTAGYNSLVFYVNGGTASGQLMTINLVDASGAFLPSVDLNPYIDGGSVASDTWRQVAVPLGVLLGSTTRISGIVIHDALGAVQPRFYIDDMEFATGGIPTSVPTDTPTKTWTPSATPTPNTPTNTSTPTYTLTNTNTPTPVPPTDTRTTAPTNTHTPTTASTHTYTPTSTNTTTVTPAPTGRCTLYASPSGSGTACSSASPCSLDTANGRAAPGNTVCLMAGTYQRTSTFYPANGSPSGGYVTFTGGINGEAIIQMGTTGQIVFFNGGQYDILQNLTVDGMDSNYYNGIYALNSHHVIVRNVYVHNTGEAGIYAYNSDYVTIDHNLIFHNGYGNGWSSATGLNRSLNFDSAPGFHYFFTNNIISGQYDNSPTHSDGGGIILDGGYDPSIHTPPVLIANNVIYSNGGRCILVFEQTGGHWIVNNTCYKNALDLQVGGCGGMTRGCSDEYFVQQTHNNYLVNNIARSWDTQHPYKACCGSTSNVLNHNLWWGNGSNQLSGFNVTSLINANPLFMNPPTVSDAIPSSPGTGWFWDALDPRQLGNRLQLQGGSPAINAGIDPATLTSDPAIRAGLAQYVYQDIVGVARPQAGAFDLGAYEYGASR